VVRCLQNLEHRRFRRKSRTRQLYNGQKDQWEEFNVQSQQIVKTVEGAELAPQHLAQPGLSVQVLEHTAAQIRLVEQFIKEQLQEGEDFGKVTGIAQPFLWKAGAENLASLFKCHATFEQMERVVDVTTGFVLFQHRCRWVHSSTGLVVLEGMGSCNSYEVKYRYRETKRSCPACKAETIRKGAAQYGGGWYCAARDGGCGAKFDDGDAAIEAQRVGRMENPDLLDGINTYMKMSMKRAEVDTAMRAPGVARFFSIDHSEDARDAAERQEEAARGPGQAPARGQARPGARQASAQRPAAPAERTCPLHNNTRLYRNPDGTYSHRLPDRSVCFGPQEAPAAPSGPSAQDSAADTAPPDLPPSMAQEVEALRTAVTDAGLSWAEFLRGYLHATWEEWLKMGGTVSKALEVLKARTGR
jgi:hypothetical protein